MWWVSRRGKTKLANPLQSRVTSGYRRLTCPRSQDSEGKMGPDSRSLSPDSRKPPCQQGISYKDHRQLKAGKKTPQGSASRDSVRGPWVSSRCVPQAPPLLPAPFPSTARKCSRAPSEGLLLGAGAREFLCDRQRDRRPGRRQAPCWEETPILDTSKGRKGPQEARKIPLLMIYVLFHFFLVILKQKVQSHWVGQCRPGGRGDRAGGRGRQGPA